MNKFIMHVNYGEVSGGNYGNRTVDDVCRLAAETGFDGIEFRAEIPKTNKELTFDEYISEIAAGKKKYGLSEILFGIGVSQASNPDMDERKKSIEKACEIAKAVNDKCGTTICNCFAKSIKSKIAGVDYGQYDFNGSAAATIEDWQLTVDAFQQVAKVIEPLGMKFAFETHMGYIHDLPAPAKELADKIGSPNIGINMDYGNTVYFRQFPGVEETIDLYGDKLFYTHLKNSVKIPGASKNHPVALSEGMINHRVYLAKLKEVGFTGPIGIEAPRPGDRAYFAKNDLEYVKSIMNS